VTPSLLLLYYLATAAGVLVIGLAGLAVLSFFYWLTGSPPPNPPKRMP
jgi:hypothetical protein